jgi:hypothetical protein
MRRYVHTIIYKEFIPLKHIYQVHQNTTQISECEIQGPHSGAAEDLHLGCDAV